MPHKYWMVAIERLRCSKHLKALVLLTSAYPQVVEIWSQEYDLMRASKVRIFIFIVAFLTILS